MGSSPAVSVSERAERRVWEVDGPCVMGGSGSQCKIGQEVLCGAAVRKKCAFLIQASQQSRECEGTSSVRRKEAATGGGA